jgi:glucose uptake protein
MYQPETYVIALLFMLLSMACWGSWANTMKLTPGWRFQHFYWDYALGLLVMSLVFGLTLGSTDTGPLSFAQNLRQSVPAGKPEGMP